MSLLTDVDIRKVLGKDIIIEPFLDDSLTPVGYDFTIGDFLYCLEDGLLVPEDGVYTVLPKSTVQIMTKESLWVSNRIAGTFHSKVSLVSKGFSHISTTLDPEWYGPLLITMRNNSSNAILFKPNDKFVTLVFFRVLTPTKTPHLKPPFRLDILLTLDTIRKQLNEQLHERADKYFEYISTTIGNPEVLAEFKRKVDEANKPMTTKIWESIKNKQLQGIYLGLGKFLIIVSIILLLTLSLYWDSIKMYFDDISYDSKILAVQFTSVISLILLYRSIDKK